MANAVDIVIRGIDQASGVFAKVGLSMVSLNQAMEVAQKVGQALSDVYKATVDEAVKYNSATIDQARLLGISTVEMSRLKQAADDVFISEEKLNTALLAASRQGIDVSTKGLKQLSEKYLSLSDGTERAQFLMKTFGRSGADMGKLMELGADGIDKATKAINSNLVVSKKSADQTIAFKKALDNWNDAWTGVKLTIGDKVIPVLTEYLVYASRVIDKTDEMTAAATKNHIGWSLLLPPVGAALNAFDELTRMITKSNDEMEKKVIPTLGTHRKFVEDDAESLVTLRNAQDDVNTSMSNATEYFKSLTLEMIYNKAAAILDADGALVLGRNLGLIDENTYNTMISIGKLTDKYDANGDEIIDEIGLTNDYINKVLGLQGTIDLLHDKTVHINVVMNGSLNNQDILPLTGNQGGSTSNIPYGSIPTGVIDAATGRRQYRDADGSYSYHAGGGSAAGWSMVGEQGPELLKLPGGSNITPNNQLGGVATISEASIMHLAKVIASEMQKVSG